MKPTGIWLFPGPVRLASYRRQLDDMETERLAEQVNLAARLMPQLPLFRRCLEEAILDSFV